jgi:hypothetical protein
MVGDVSLNVVHLLGLVVARPALDVAQRRCTLLVVTTPTVRDIHERHRVLAGGALATVAAELVVGQSVLVAGRLARDERGRVVSVARELWAVAEAPEAARGTPAIGRHHASPREHERAGHWRRIHTGTARERLSWVRATTVRGRSGAPAEPAGRVRHTAATA